MLRFVPRAWSILSGRDDASLARADWLRREIIAPVMADLPGSREGPRMSAPLPSDRVAGTTEAKALEQAPLIIAEATGSKSAVYYQLGVRDLLADGLTIVFDAAPEPDDFSKSLGPRFIHYRQDDPSSARAQFSQVLKRLSQGDDDLDPKLKLRFSHLDIRPSGSGPAPRGRTEWCLTGEDGVERKTRLGVWSGDLATIAPGDGIDVIVNSESIFLEMARFHDPGVSAVIRWLGSRNNTETHSSNDAIFRELIERAQHRRPVVGGYVVFTSSVRLKERGVKRLCHVAAVRPRGWPKDWQPGRGYEPVPNLKDCMTNALTRLEERRGSDRVPANCSVLFPLFGAGNGRADPGTVANLLVETAAQHILGRRVPSNITHVLLMAYTLRERELCEQAIARLANARPIQQNGAG